MSKVAHYLQEHLLGEVTSSTDARNHFSTDASLFSVTPSVIVYPRNEHDIRKTARFAWQLAERGRKLPLTARGAGTDYSGAAIGEGVVLAFPAHMNRIIQLDTKTGEAIVEPGLIFGRLQQTLQTHDRFLPAYPTSFEYSTIGGAVANDASGEKSFKYGTMRDYTKGVRVVLSNGDIISTKRLNKRELSKKLGLTNFEGEIYRNLDKLIEENRELIESLQRGVTKDTAGYNIADVKSANGSFDLTPLFAGSQGTLGIITEVTLSTEPFNPQTTLVMASFESIDSACEAIQELRNMTDRPSTIEMVDGHLISLVNRLNPNQLKDLVHTPVPAIVLLIEFDDVERVRRKAVRRALTVLERLATGHQTARSYDEQTKLWKIRYASSSLLTHSEKHLKSVPIIDDAVVPPSKLAELIKGTYKIFSEAKLQVALWGSAGDANLHVAPFLDLSQIGDRQRAMKIYEQYYKLVMELGGSTSGQHNDGRIRGPLLEDMYGKEGLKLLRDVKKIFDPFSILNPGVKTAATKDALKSGLREDYGLGYLHNFMPRS